MGIVMGMGMDMCMGMGIRHGKWREQANGSGKILV